MVQTHLPHLAPPVIAVLGLWSFGMCRPGHGSRLGGAASEIAAKEPPLVTKGGSRLMVAGRAAASCASPPRGHAIRVPARRSGSARPSRMWHQG
jgi:hypothetical protein